MIRLADDPIFTDDLSAAMEIMPIVSLVLDFSSVTYLKSSNLSSLLILRSRLKTTDRELRLCGASDRVWGLFVATGLNQLFDRDANVEQAIASLQSA